MNNQTLKFTRYADRVVIDSAIGGITIEQLINDAEDNNFSLNSSVTGHLMLLDDRFGVTYMLNDYGLDVIEKLNEVGKFIAPVSTLEYELFVTEA